MFRNIASAISACFVALFLVGNVSAQEQARIVSWNASPSLYEALEKRLNDFKQLDAAMNPDVLVLIEVAGEHEVRKIIKALGWPKYHAVVTNWANLNDRVHFALEAAVISKFPITKAVEFDASPDGHLSVFNQDGPVTGISSEQQLSSQGIAGFGDPLGRHDRGTIRVDLNNGLTIFPLHLKSNRVGACIDLNDAKKGLRKAGIPIPAQVDQALANGFPRATKDRISNAKKRERVMAATVKVANVAIAEGRTVVLAGDMNTSYEPGLVGSKVADCDLQTFTCDKGKLPATACVNGDGYDDTLGGILEAGLVGSTKWKVLSKALERTYDDPVFANHAIDHFAVPVGVAGQFTDAEKGTGTFGSDHFPIAVTFEPK